jgi:hypothetical protein
MSEIATKTEENLLIVTKWMYSFCIMKVLTIILYSESVYDCMICDCIDIVFPNFQMHEKDLKNFFLWWRPFSWFRAPYVCLLYLNVIMIQTPGCSKVLR